MIIASKQECKCQAIQKMSHINYKSFEIELKPEDGKWLVTIRDPSNLIVDSNTKASQEEAEEWAKKIIDDTIDDFISSIT